MASGENHHGKTKVLYKVNPFDFGPFNVLLGDHYNNFAGGCYYMTTPKENYIKVYRLYGGNAAAEGQYWTLDRRHGNDGYRHDAAVLKHWNTLEHDVTLKVPKGVHMYEGYVGPQKGYLGGGRQVFIPRDVVKSLFKMQETNGNRKVIAKEVEAIEKLQKQTFKEWQDGMIRRIEANALAKGCFLRQLPTDVRRFFGKMAKVTTLGK